MDLGDCATVDPELFFPAKGGVEGAIAKQVCAGCSVRTECAEYAITKPWLDGIWGGLSPLERRELRNGAAA